MAEVTEKDARLWNMLCHLSALALFTCIPFANIIGPLVVWLIKRQEIPSVDAHGKESVNFQITVVICAIALWIPTFLLSLVSPIFFVLGYLLIIPLGLANLILIIMASMKVNNGEPYTYPFALRFIK